MTKVEEKLGVMNVMIRGSADTQFAKEGVSGVGIFTMQQHEIVRINDSERDVVEK